MNFFLPQEKRQFLDRDDRFIENERIPPENRGRSWGEEGYQADEFEADPYIEEWNEDFPRRPLPPDFEFRGPPREFEQRWAEDQGLRDERFPRRIEDTDRRHFDGRWGPPPDWERRSPPFLPERLLCGHFYLVIGEECSGYQLCSFAFFLSAQLVLNKEEQV